MQKALDAMTVALRVLTAINNHQKPDPADVQSLAEYAPDFQGEHDLLACEVIQRALWNRAQARKAGGKIK